jgi:hypothetical protein
MHYINGRIFIGILTDGGKDEFNQPLPATIEWTDRIPCHIQTITHRNDGSVTDGIFTNSSYKIWFGTYSLNNSVMKLFDEENQPKIERVKVIKDKVDIGEWQVQNVLVKHITGRVEILIGNRMNRLV